MRVFNPDIMRRSSHVRFFSVWMVDFFAVNFFREWLSPRAEDTSSVLCPFTAWHAVLKDEPSISQQNPTANSAHHVHLEPLLAVHAAENSAPTSAAVQPSPISPSPSPTLLACSRPVGGIAVVTATMLNMVALHLQNHPTLRHSFDSVTSCAGPSAHLRSFEP